MFVIQYSPTTIEIAGHQPRAAEIQSTTSVAAPVSVRLLIAVVVQVRREEAFTSTLPT
jgi:hypothetical protein